jgi:hypothetical protein
MTLLLQWRQPDPPLVLRWRGPEGGIAPAAAASSPLSVPTLIGPPGLPGPVGPQGPVAEIIDGGTFS